VRPCATCSGPGAAEVETKEAAKPTSLVGQILDGVLSWRVLGLIQTVLLLVIAVLLVQGNRAAAPPSQLWPGDQPGAAAIAGLQRDIAALQEFARIRESLDADGMALLHSVYLQRARNSDRLAVELAGLHDQLRTVQARLAEAAVAAAVADIPRSAPTATQASSAAADGEPAEQGRRPAGADRPPTSS